ncbi:MAG TPA: lycopene cyclase domain-containing protein [Patescibacteria group bacterium]|nr:lycopene cyclase domain-containing protein [Patescibacteria group bacterium]
MLYDYAYLIGSLLLLVVWFGLFLAKPKLRKKMLWVSGLTTTLGLTEPIFIPKYWAPLTLFDWGRKYHLDIESFIFSFAVSGVAAVIYEFLTGKREKRLAHRVQHQVHHQLHTLAVLSPIAVFTFFFLLTPLNPIYSAVIGLTFGALATAWCRPDLGEAIKKGALLFAGLYFAVFWITFVLLFPGYVPMYWKLSNLTGILILGVPIEELLFAGSLGAMWGGLYEHLTWHKLVRMK